jgi:predicted lipoprotein with Yx(FWY)xxD motif
MSGGSGPSALGALAAGSIANGATAPTVSLHKTKLGLVLVNSKGHALYLFMKDKNDKSACSGACAKYWPPLISHGKPVGGAGVNPAMLSRTGRSDGSMQVTYEKHPLYTFALDKQAGQTNGQAASAFGASGTPYPQREPQSPRRPRTAATNSAGGDRQIEKDRFASLLSSGVARPRSPFGGRRHRLCSQPAFPPLSSPKGGRSRQRWNDRSRVSRMRSRRSQRARRRRRLGNRRSEVAGSLKSGSLPSAVRGPIWRCARSDGRLGCRFPWRRRDAALCGKRVRSRWHWTFRSARRSFAWELESRC